MTLSNSHHIIESLEAKELNSRPFYIKVADYLTNTFGSIAFLILNAIFFAIWIIINTNKVPGITPFDPFPFTLLTMVVSLEAILLSIIVLMSAQRQNYITTLREEMDMQINLISEREVTMVLKLLNKILEKSKVKVDEPELVEMLKETDISYIERRLEEQITGASKKTDQIMQDVVRPVGMVAKAIENKVITDIQKLESSKK